MSKHCTNKRSWSHNVTIYQITSQYQNCKYKRNYSFGRKVNNPELLLIALNYSHCTLLFGDMMVQNVSAPIILHAFSSLFYNVKLLKIPYPFTR
jgi:hypothetical protein